MKTKEDILQQFLGLHAEDPITEMDEFQKSAAYDAMDQYAAQVLENQDPWISVKDRLPEKGIRVLVWEGTITWEAYIDFDGKWKWSHVDGDLHPTDHITHWTSMPEPPKTTPIKPEE